MDEDDPYAFHASDDEDFVSFPSQSPTRPTTSGSNQNAGEGYDAGADSITSIEYAKMARRIERELERGDGDEDEDDEEEEEGRESDEGIDLHPEYPEGMLLWAKLKGYSYWPSIVTVDPMGAKTVTDGDGVRRRRKVHVHFIGYENQRAWIAETSILAFSGKADYMSRANDCKKGKKKDFFPSASLRKPFEDAVKEAETVVELTRADRLKKLGFVYVLVPPSKVQVKTAAQKKFLSPSSSSSSSAAPAASSSSSFPSPVLGQAPAVSNNSKVQAGQKRRSYLLQDGDEALGGKKQKSEVVVNQKKFGKTMGKKSSNGVNNSTGPGRKRGPKKKKAVKANIASLPFSASSSQFPPPSTTPSPPPSVKISTPFKSDEIKDIGADDDEFYSEPEPEPDGDGGDAFSSSAPRRDNSPKLGGLVWGRMCGFPYWPCFITKNPDGEYKRKRGKGTSYHVQFFNWNDESGWVSKILPWCSLEEFKQQADRVPKSKPQEYKAWHPTGKGMAKKWMEAYDDAQSTSEMTRRERHDGNVVFYKDKGADMIFEERFLEAAVKKGGMLTSARRKSDNTSPVQQQRPQNGEVTATPPAKPKQKRRRLRGPMCVRQRIPLDSLLSTDDLPRGWSMRRVGKGRREFSSPDGAVFASMRDVVRHLFRQNVVLGPYRRRSISVLESDRREPVSGEGGSVRGWLTERVDAARFNRMDCAETEEAEPETELQWHHPAAGNLDGGVGYTRDCALPPRWMVKTERGRVVYVSPEEKIFASKWEVAEHLEPSGHPANELEMLMSRTVVRCRERRDRIMQRRLQRQIDKEEEMQSRVSPTPTKKPKVEEEEEDVSAPLEFQDDGDDDDANGCAYTIDLNGVTAQDLLNHPVMNKTVIPSLVEMVKLPAIFLEHPHVKVKEEHNEMTITDLDTNEFIAKKIIYD